MATLWWMGVPEAEVRMVEGMYEKTTARMVMGEGASEEFEVNIGLRQGSLLRPLLDLISRNTVVKDAMKKFFYADGLSLVENGKQELQETLDEWNGLFTRHALNSNLDKIEVLHIGHQREKLDIELVGKKPTQGYSFEGHCVETGRRGERYVEEYKPKRTRGERLRVNGGAAALKKTKGQGHEHLCYTGMSVRNRNLVTVRTITTKAASMRKQLGTKDSKSN